MKHIDDVLDLSDLGLEPVYDEEASAEDALPPRKRLEELADEFETYGGTLESDGSLLLEEEIWDDPLHPIYRKGF